MQLQVNHPGGVAPFTFDNLTFGTPPSSGFYLGAADLNPSDGQVLTLDVTNSTPATPGNFVQTAGGAVVNWPPVVGGTRTWAGGTSSDWNDPANWSPAMVPNGLDDVVIGPATFEPVLTANSTASTVTVSGTGASLAINGFQLTVSNGFTVTSNGLLVMTNPSDLLNVAGAAVFQGGNESGQLTAGVLRVAGNFTQAAGSFQSFQASGTHKVILNGSAPQTVSFNTPGVGNSVFQELDLANAAGVQFLSSLTVAGNLTLTTPLALSDAGTQTLTVLGLLTTPATSSLTLANFTTPTAPAIGGSYSVGTTTYTAALTAPVLPYTNLVVSAAAVTPGGNLTTTGSLVLTGTGASLPVGPTTLTVGTSLTVQSNALLGMTDPASVVNVAGAAVFQGGNESGQLTAGVLRVAGNFTQAAGSFQSFQASGTHKVILNGSAAQTVSFNTPGVGNSVFQDLDLANAAGVQFLSSLTVAGNLTLTTPLALSDAGTQTLTVLGLLTTPATSSLTLANFTTPTAPAIGGSYSVGTTTYTAALTAPVLPYTNLVVSAAAVTPGGNLTTTGSLVLTGTGASLPVGPTTLTVGTSLTVQSNALLGMTDPASVVNVAGAAVFQGGNESGQLTAGVLRVAGNFTQAAGSFQSFQPSGTHKVILNGSAPQTVSFNTPGVGNSVFQELDLANAAGVQFLSSLTVAGNLTLTTPLALSDAGTQTLTVLGLLTTPATSSLTLANFTTPTAPAIGGSYSVGTTTYTAALTAPVLPYTNLVVSAAAVTPGGNLTTTGSLVLTGTGASLPVGPTTLTVGTSLTVQSNALLGMTDPASVVNVAGAAVFQGGNESGQLTAGVLRVAGNFTQAAGSFQSFQASGTHKVILNGSAAQTVSFNTPGVGNSVFQDLDLANAAGVQFLSSLTVAGNLTLTTPLALSDAGTQTLTVLGLLTTPATSSLTLANFTTPTAPAIGGSYSVGTTTYTAALTAPVLPYTNLVVSAAAVTPGGNLTTTGSLVLTGTGASLPVGPTTLTVGTSLTVQSNALLGMTDPASVVNVAGAAVFQGGNESGQLTAGVLRVAGNFTQAAGSFQSFQPSGTHKVILNGSAPQTVSFNTPGVGNSVFQELDLANAAGVQFLSSLTVAGNLTLTTPLALSDAGTQTLTVLGLLTTPATSSLTLANFTTPTAPAIGGSYSVGTTTYTAALTAPVLPYTNLVVSAAAVTPGGNLTTTGSLVLTGTGASLPVGPTTLTVGTSLTVQSNALLGMTDPASVVNVAGAAVFQGGNESGQLTAGVLRVAGNFTQAAGSFQSFLASGTHKVILNGSSPQTVSFNTPGVGNSVFQELDLANAAGVQFLSSLTVAGNLTLTTPLALSDAGTQTLTVLGLLTTPATSSLTLANFTTPTAPAIGGSYSVGTTTYTAALTAPVLPYTNLVVSAAAVTPGGNLTTTGSLVLTGTGASLPVGPTTLTVGTSLTVQSNALLGMTDPASVVNVAGAAVFQGGNESGQLTAGVLRVAGNFTQAAGSFQSFLASGTHKVILNGSSPQTVSFNTPGVGNSVFQELDISPQNGGVILSSNIVIAGTLTAQPGAGTLAISGGGRTVTAGALSVDGLKLDNAPFIWNEPVASAAQFDNVQFVNFSGTVTQFKATVFGGAAAPRNVTLKNLVFTHVTSAPGLYVDLASANSFGINLIMQGASESPQLGGNGPTFSNPPNQTSVGGATVLWP